MRTLLGLDIGTLGVKGVVITTGGYVLARARREHAPHHPQPGWAEHDATADWWGDGAAVLRELTLAADVDPAAIAAVGISGLTPCLLPVAADGAPLRPAILYSDNRALAELAAANAVLPASLTAQAVIPKWRWLQAHEPELAAATACLLSSHNYVVYRLTGVISMDYDTASIMGGVFDTAARAWDVERCALLDVAPGILPPLHPVTAVVGHVTAAAAAATGLRAGTPVIAGTGDTFPTLVGCGAVHPGDAMIALGTTGLLTLTTHSLEQACAGPHFAGAGDAGAVLWAANVLACGQLLAWFRDQFGASLRQIATGQPAAPRTYAWLDSLAEMTPPGAENLVALPHLMGRRTPTPDPDMRGLFFGLAPTHGASHLYRALLESISFALKRGYTPIADRTRRVVVTAGGAASPLWRQILADMLETPIEHHPQASGGLGIAFLAGYATGLLSSFAVLSDTWLADPALTLPRPSVFPTYRRLYDVYCALDDTLGPIFQRLR